MKWVRSILIRIGRLRAIHCLKKLLPRTILDQPQQTLKSLPPAASISTTSSQQLVIFPLDPPSQLHHSFPSLVPRLRPFLHQKLRQSMMEKYTNHSTSGECLIVLSVHPTHHLRALSPLTCPVPWPQSRQTTHTHTKSAACSPDPSHRTAPTPLTASPPPTPTTSP